MSLQICWNFKYPGGFREAALITLLRVLYGFWLYLVMVFWLAYISICKIRSWASLNCSRIFILISYFAAAFAFLLLLRSF